MNFRISGIFSPQILIIAGCSILHVVIGATMLTMVVAQDK
jgi:hypothetical protein